MDKILNWLKTQLLQPSTWRGVAVLAGAVGIGISPENWQTIGTTVAGILGVVEIIRNEIKKPTPPAA